MTKYFTVFTHTRRRSASLSHLRLRVAQEISPLLMMRFVTESRDPPHQIKLPVRCDSPVIDTTFHYLSLYDSIVHDMAERAE